MLIKTLSTIALLTLASLGFAVLWGTFLEVGSNIALLVLASVGFAALWGAFRNVGSGE